MNTTDTYDTTYAALESLADQHADMFEEGRAWVRDGGLYAQVAPGGTAFYLGAVEDCELAKAAIEDWFDAECNGPSTDE